MIWKLADAKTKLDEVLDRALKEGPQTIARKGGQVVVLSKKAFRELAKSRAKTKTFAAHLLSFPKVAELNLDRESWPERDVFSDSLRSEKPQGTRRVARKRRATK